MDRIPVGTRVRNLAAHGWRTGEVVCEVAPLANPLKIFHRWFAAAGGEWKGSNATWVGRDDWSYIVRSGRNYYWPRRAMFDTGDDMT